EIHNDLGYVTGHDRNLLLGQTGTARRHYILDASLMQAQTVKISLDDHQAAGFLCRVSRQVECVKHIGLRIEGGLGRIEILRLGVCNESASTEPDRLTAFIPERKHQAAAETVLDFPALLFSKHSAAR